MKRISINVFTLAAVLVSGSAFAYSCPNDMKAVDAAMASSSLSEADMEEVMALREKGEKLHKSGNHSGSVKALNQAKEILGL